MGLSEKMDREDVRRKCDVKCRLCKNNQPEAFRQSMWFDRPEESGIQRKMERRDHADPAHHYG